MNISTIILVALIHFCGVGLIYQTVNIIHINGLLGLKKKMYKG